MPPRLTATDPTENATTITHVGNSYMHENMRRKPLVPTSPRSPQAVTTVRDGVRLAIDNRSGRGGAVGATAPRGQSPPSSASRFRAPARSKRSAARSWARRPAAAAGAAGEAEGAAGAWGRPPAEVGPAGGASPARPARRSTTMQPPAAAKGA